MTMASGAGTRDRLTATKSPDESLHLSDLAKRRLDEEGGAFLLADWLRTVFINYRVCPTVLQPLIPFELDTRGGDAYVSVVAFLFDRVRIASLGEASVLPCRPVSHHGFLNLRTYVRHDDEPGIFFMREYLPSRLSICLGPRAYGLPYRLGRTDYRHDHERGVIRGLVEPHAPRSPGARYMYEGRIRPGQSFEPAGPGSLEAFLLERYAAFTALGGVGRRFRVWHEPWKLAPIDLDVTGDSLLRESGPWVKHAELASIYYSPGVRDVWMGRPTCLAGAACGVLWPVRRRAGRC